MKKVLVVGTNNPIDRLKKIVGADVDIVSLEEAKEQGITPDVFSRQQTFEITNPYVIDDQNPFHLPRQKVGRIVARYNPKEDKPTVTRNQQCTCGSGKKFKNCCINKRYKL